MPKETALQKQVAIATAKIAARRGEAGLPPPTLPAKKTAVPPAAATKAKSAIDHILADDAAPKAPPAKVVLQKISSMVALMRDAEKKVDAAETQLKTDKANLFRIASVDLPTLLKESGVKDITIEDGTKVEAKDDFTCSITDERKADCLAWLRKEGHEAVIKMFISVAFGKGQSKAADKLYLQLLKKFEDVQMKEGVHPQTLKALLKELVEDGKTIPEDTFGVFRFQIAKLTAPKAKR